MAGTAAGTMAAGRRPDGVGDVAFVPMDPIMISLPPGASARLLRFTGQLEAEPEHSAEVAQLMPRILDVLNTFLRAVESRDLEQPASLARCGRRCCGASRWSPARAACATC